MRVPEKCSRCGSPLGDDFQFCQVCGLAIGIRAPRPQTQRLKVLTTEVRKLRKRSIGEHSTPREDFPIIAKDPPKRGPRRGTGRRAGARGPAPTADVPAKQKPSPTAVPETVMAPVPAPAQVTPAWSAHAVSGVREPLPVPSSGSRTGSSPEQVGNSGVSPLRLVLVNRDGSDGESFFFPDAALTLGRRGSDLSFAHDDFLSPVHARLEPRADGIWLVDLNSLNGIFLRISTTMPVFPGDLILLGHQLLRLDNVPDPPIETDVEIAGARLFGTPLDPAWACLTRIGYGGATAESYYLRSTVVVLGREQGDIVFGEDAFISRQHAQLGVTVKGKAMSVSLSDLGSANGTYMKIRGEVRIDVGDMFRIGDQIFRLRIDP